MKDTCIKIFSSRNLFQRVLSDDSFMLSASDFFIKNRLYLRLFIDNDNNVEQLIRALYMDIDTESWNRAENVNVKYTVMGFAGFYKNMIKSEEIQNAVFTLYPEHKAIRFVVGRSSDCSYTFGRDYPTVYEHVISTVIKLVLNTLLHSSREVFETFMREELMLVQLNNDILHE